MINVHNSFYGAQLDQKGAYPAWWDVVMLYSLQKLLLDNIAKLPDKTSPSESGSEGGSLAAPELDPTSAKAEAEDAIQAKQEEEKREENAWIAKAVLSSCHVMDSITRLLIHPPHRRIIYLAEYITNDFVLGWVQGDVSLMLAL